MYICNYCNRVLKQEYEKCPGCGGSSFKTKAFLGETIIKEPPKGGYKINTENYKKSLRIANIFVIIGLVLVIQPILFTLPFLFLGFTDALMFIPFEASIGLIMFFIAYSSKKKTKKAHRIK